MFSQNLAYMPFIVPEAPNAFWKCTMPCALLRSSDALAGVDITTSSFEVGSLYVKAVPFKYKKCFGGEGI